MAYSDRLMQEIENKRTAAVAALGAYVSALRDGKKLIDPKTGAKEKIDIILPPIVKFNEIVKISKM